MTKLLNNINGLRKLSVLLVILLMLVLCINKNCITILCSTILCLISFAAIIGDMEKKKRLSNVTCLLLIIGIYIFYGWMLFNSEQAKLEIVSIFNIHSVLALISLLIVLVFMLYCIYFIAKLTFKEKHI